METENRVLPTLLNESNPSSERERIKLLVAKLARFYSVMGNRPDEPGALALIAEILCQSGTDEQIAQSMTRCTRECRYPVRLPDFLQRMSGHEIPALEAETRRAWDELLQFVRKYVSNDVYGNYGPEHGWYPNHYPKLSRRIQDAVQRTGGWKVYKCMNERDFPFVQKRFQEEYVAWSAVERVAIGTMLVESPRPQLVANRISVPKPEVQAKPAHPKAVIKKIPEPLTAAQRQDRREMLRQQAEFLSNTRPPVRMMPKHNPNGWT
jgi:hypothetical protein